MTSPSEARLLAPGPKRILALDGGGIMGVLTLCYLERIETILRDKHGGGDDFTLSDYFDLIGGTSTGAIIAGGLAVGRPVGNIRRLYRDLGMRVFRRRRWRLPGLLPRFPTREILSALKAEFGDIRLGGDEVLTGLAVLAKRYDTGSPWILHNNPRGKFYGPGDDPGDEGNARFLLAEVVRASTAAPFFFAPQQIRLSGSQTGLFVDGAVSPYGNPSLILFLMSTLKAFGFEWKTGEDEMQIVSVGTASRSIRLEPVKSSRSTPLLVAVRSLTSLLDDTDQLSQIMLQAFGRSVVPWHIDSELGDMAGEQLAGEPLFTYLRHGIRLESDWLKEYLDLDMPDDKVAKLYRIDDASNINALEMIGDRAAERFVAADQFQDKFIRRETRPA